MTRSITSQTPMAAYSNTCLREGAPRCRIDTGQFIWMGKDSSCWGLVHGLGLKAYMYPYQPENVVTFRAVTHFPLEWFSWWKAPFLAKIKGFQGKLLGHTNFPLGKLKWLLPTRKPCEVKGALGSWQTKRQLYFASPQMEVLWKALPTKFPC